MDDLEGIDDLVRDVDLGDEGADADVSGWMVASLHQCCHSCYVCCVGSDK